MLMGSCLVQSADAEGLSGDGESAKEAQLLESWKAYKKGFHEGVALFNDKPKRGIAFMQVLPHPRSQGLDDKA